MRGCSLLHSLCGGDLWPPYFSDCSVKQRFLLSVAYLDENEQNYYFNNLVLTGSTREFMGLPHP